MKLNERDLRRLSRQVITEQTLNEQIADAKSPQVQALARSRKGQALEKKVQGQAGTLLQRSENSLRTVGDLKKAIKAVLVKRSGQREKAGFWSAIGGTVGGLIFPLLSIFTGGAAQKVAAAKAAGAAGSVGAITSTAAKFASPGWLALLTIPITGLVGFLTNAIVHKNQVRGTALQDFAVNPRILNAIPDHIEEEFVNYMANVIQGAPDNTPLVDFDMTKELLYFMKSKYGLDIKDLASQSKQLAAGVSRAGTNALAERRIFAMKVRASLLYERRDGEADSSQVDLISRDIKKAIVDRKKDWIPIARKLGLTPSKVAQKIFAKIAKDKSLKSNSTGTKNNAYSLTESEINWAITTRFKDYRKASTRTTYKADLKNIRLIASQTAAGVMTADYTGKGVEKAKADTKKVIAAALKAGQITPQEMKKIEKIMKSRGTTIKKYGDIATLLSK